MKIKLFEISAFAALIICIVSCIAFEKDCENIRENVLRLHIIADSNSAEAQTLKLKVRDAVLEQGRDIFTGNTDISAAEKSLGDNLELLRDVAQKTIEENGYTYSARVELTSCYFPTRQYGDITLPAGEYNAVRILLGSGEGENWWCVMFPPMCLPAAEGEKEMLGDVLNGKSMEIVSESEKYEVRLWIVEKWYELKAWLEG